MNVVSSVIKATAKNKNEIKVENSGKYAMTLFFIKLKIYRIIFLIDFIV